MRQRWREISGPCCVDAASMLRRFYADSASGWGAADDQGGSRGERGKPAEVPVRGPEITDPVLQTDGCDTRIVYAGADYPSLGQQAPQDIVEEGTEFRFSVAQRKRAVISDRR
jgi:hypothetical protein